MEYIDTLVTPENVECNLELVQPSPGLDRGDA